MPLTQLERASLPFELNLADGHASQPWTPAQSSVIGNLSELYVRSTVKEYESLYSKFQRHFFSFGNQLSAIDESGNILEFYSASQAIEAVAHVVRIQGRACHITEPNFDNIPDIFRRVGVHIQPIAESELFDSSSYHEAIQGLAGGALFVTNPGNPTGAYLGEQQFYELAAACADLDVVLLVDFSFRFFCRQLGAFDQYAILRKTGCKFVGIEDTGKTWPTRDLKVGLCVPCQHIVDQVRRIHFDCLLNIPPVTLALLNEFIAQSAFVEGEDFRSIIELNRSLLRRALDVRGLAVANLRSTSSVEWISLDHGHGDLFRHLLQRGLRVLPGDHFFWSDRSKGRDYIRIALARDPLTIEAATKIILEMPS
jgi:aspartate/methionine/tyrosine aminotransferase